MIRSRCRHTGELVLLGVEEVVYVAGGPGELARARTLMAGEIVTKACGRELHIIGDRRSHLEQEAQHDLAGLELGG